MQSDFLNTYLAVGASYSVTEISISSLHLTTFTFTLLFADTSAGRGVPQRGDYRTLAGREVDPTD